MKYLDEKLMRYWALRTRVGPSVNNIASVWRENMHRYLSADVVCSEKQIVFQKTLSFDELIEFKNKHPRIFLKSIGSCFVYYFSSIFRNPWDLLNIRHIAQIFPVLAILVPRGRAPFGQHQES